MPADGGQEGKDYGGMAFAAGFAALGIWAVAQTRHMSDLAATFPRTIGLAMIGLSVGLIVLSLIRAPRSRLHRPPGSAVRRAGLVLLMLGWVLAMPTIGFYLSSLVAFLALCLVANYDPLTGRRVLTWMITAVAVVSGFYLLFSKLLLVPLPGPGWL